MNNNLSIKIKLAVFLATLIVVLRHSINLHLYNPNAYNEVPQDFNTFFQVFTNKFTTLAVPFFFMVSGLLLFRNYVQTCSGYQIKIRKRFKSLIIPYTIINVTFSSFMLLFLTLSDLNFISDFVSIDSINLISVLDYTFIKPSLGQLWYIRDLILFVLFSPILFIVFKNKPATVLVFFLFVLTWEPVDTKLFSSEGVLFFYIGAYLGINLDKVNFSTKPNLLILLLFCFISVFFNLALTFDWFPMLHPLKLKFSIIFNIMTFWFLIDCIKENTINRWSSLFKFSFMIYVLHSPLIKVIYKPIIIALPDSIWWGSLLYVTAPVLTILLCIYFAKLISILFPRTYSLLTGGR